jgi:hypothetical protein
MTTYRPALFGLLAAVAAPALAQDGYQQQQQQQPQQRMEVPRPEAGRQQPQQQQTPQVRLSREEIAAIRPLQQAVQASNWEAASAALPAAQAAAQQPAARFEVGRLQFQIGAGTQNQALQSQAVDAMLASGAAPATAMPTLLGARANYAIQANDWATADQMLTRYLEVDANNVERLRQAAEVKINLQRNGDALAIYQRILQVQDAANQQPTQEVLRRTLALATDQRNAQLVQQLTQRLLSAYPSADSWLSALAPLRNAAGQDAALALDVRRLMRVAGALPRAGDYVDFADRLNRSGQPGEVKALLDEGIARGTITASNADVRQMLTAATARIAEDRASLPGLRTRAMAAPTGREARIAGDTFYGYGEYAQAAELYRAALQKGGEDANLLNIRLGAALAGARRTAEAQAAFRAVTGPRQPLAAYWLMWLERPATAAAPATPPAAPATPPRQ